MDPSPFPHPPPENNKNTLNEYKELVDKIVNHLNRYVKWSLSLQFSCFSWCLGVGKISFDTCELGQIAYLCQLW